MSSQFYYPYFSARDFVPQPSQPLLYDHQLHHPDNILQERRQIQDVISQRQESMHLLRLMEYEESLRLKQRRIEVGQDKQDYISKEDRPVTSRYFQELQQKLRSKERQRVRLEEKLLKNQMKSSSLDFKQQYKDHSQIQVANEKKTNGFMLKNGKIRQENRQHLQRSQIQSQRVIQQYQQQLLDKINAKCKLKKKGQKRNNNGNGYSERYRLDDVTGGEDIIINKRTLQDRQTDGQNRKTITHKNSHLSSYENSIKANRANYHTINIAETIKKNSQKSQINISQIQIPFLQPKYKTINSKKAKNKPFKERKNSTYSQKKSNKIKNKLQVGKNERSTIQQRNPLDRIKNRFKVSMIVFKDSQLKNNRYETNHLLNTYQTEVRLRKEVKDRINNHPMVLEKHCLVVTSR